VVGLILPESFRFSVEDSRQVYDRLGIKEVVSFLPGETPKLTGISKGAWLEMTLEKVTTQGRESFTPEFKDTDAFKAKLDELFKTKGVGVFGVDFEILALGKSMFSEAGSKESLFDFCKEGIDRIVKEFDKDPAHQYKKGRHEGRNIEKELLAIVDESVWAQAVTLIKGYRSKTADRDTLAAQLHAVLLKISKNEGKYLPSFATEDDKERYIASAAGYLYGALESRAYRNCIQQDRPFVDSRHKETFGMMVVEAQLVLGTRSGTLTTIIEGLTAMQKAPQARLEEILVKTKEIDARIARGATITEVYPAVLATTNELQAIVDSEGGDNVPLALAELLRIIDVYADRNEKTFIDKVRQKALDALPAAIKGIQCAA
jgi:hypothetical protein